MSINWNNCSYVNWDIVQEGGRASVGKIGTEAGAELAAKEASKIASKEAAELAAKEASKIASKEAAELAAKEASKIASKEAAELAAKEAVKTGAKTGLSTAAKVGLVTGAGLLLYGGITYFTKPTTANIIKIEQLQGSKNMVVITYRSDPPAHVLRETPITISGSDSTPKIDGEYTVVKDISESQIQIQAVELSQPGTTGKLDIHADKSPFGILKGAKKEALKEASSDVKDVVNEAGDTIGDTFGDLLDTLGISMSTFKLILGGVGCFFCIIFILWVLLSLS